MHIIDGKKIALQIEEKVRKRAAGHNIKVATILIKGNDASYLYARLKKQACQRVGFTSVTKSFPLKTNTEQIVQTVMDLNRDCDVQGIMVQLPLPNVDYERVVSVISPEKDVEGVHPCNLGRTLLGNEHLVPCTPLAVIKILQHEKITLSGKHVVIVNHSAIIGKPLSILMLNRNATVTVCNVYTENLERHTQQADILVTGAGVKGLITPEHVKRGVTLIDVAIILEKNGLCGDVCIDGMDGIVGSLTPVPGGVGPVTVACMLENVLIAAGLEKN